MIDQNDKKDPDFFQKYGLEVSREGYDDLEEGQTYPIYGMITKFLDETPGALIVEVNFSLTMEMSVDDSDKIELLKERSMEPGIFVSELIDKREDGDEQPLFRCGTVVFGKAKEHDA